MALKKIRVHELSKELGMTSKELLALAQKLGIGASSPSASIEDAQADRIRRRADADGLRRSVQPEESKGKSPRVTKTSADADVTTSAAPAAVAAPSATAESSAPPAAPVPPTPPPAAPVESEIVDAPPRGAQPRHRPQARAYAYGLPRRSDHDSPDATSLDGRRW